MTIIRSKIKNPDFSYKEPRYETSFKLIENKYSPIKQSIKKEKNPEDEWNYYNVFSRDKYTRLKEIWLENVWLLLK